MKTKLTLTIDRETLRKARALSRRRKKTISGIIEEYLKQITDKKENSIVDKLIGAAEGTYPNDMPYEQIVRESATKKYRTRK